MMHTVVGPQGPAGRQPGPGPRDLHRVPGGQQGWRPDWWR